MPSFRIRLAGPTLNALKEMLKKAEHRSDLSTVKRVNAILSLIEGHSYSIISAILRHCRPLSPPVKKLKIGLKSPFVV